MKPELNSLKARIQNLLASPDYTPLRISEVITALKVPPKERGHIRRIMDRLLREGAVLHVRKDRLVLPSHAEPIIGRLQMNERGFGFVIPSASKPGQPAPADIFIPAENTGTAMHGDTVEVRVQAEAPRSSARGAKRLRSSHASKSEGPRGHIIRIVEHAHSTLIGTLHRGAHAHFVTPDEYRIGHDIHINLSGNPHHAKTGDRVIVKLHPWHNRNLQPEGVIQEVLGRADDPTLDLLVIVKKFKFRTDFPNDVLAQADAIEEIIPEEERVRRMDFTKHLVITIDPDDARDHDDALSLHKLPHGHWQLGVHIADVSHYVSPGSALDKEARERGNSVYLPDRVIPMLPQRLSNGICSLKENVERLTQSVLFDITPHGEVKSFTFHDGIIRAANRLTYKQAMDIITDGRNIPKKAPEKEVTAPDIRRLVTELAGLARKVRTLRFANGSLDLDFPELKIYCDINGMAERIEKSDNDESHQLVEEFMLLANEAVASEIMRRTVPSLYRIHEDPDPERLEQLRDLVIANGHNMGDPTAPGEIQKFLKSIAGKPEEYILKLNLLRSLKRAQYSTSPIGHFGLAKENYTHFTSPIRRYADLIVHRSLLRATRSGRKAHLHPSKHESSYDTSTLDTIAHHCSTTERVADEAEKEAVRLKLIEYFERQLHAHKLDSLDALVTEVRNYGVLLELPEFMLSGLIHISALDDDFYQFDPVRQKLTGKRNRRILQPGSRIRVEVTRVDRQKRQVDFRLAK